LIELLDLIAESDRQGVGLELTGVADGFHTATVLSMSDQSLGCGECGVSFTSSALASGAVERSPHGGDLAYTELVPGVHAMYRPTVKVLKPPAWPSCSREEHR
jgi:hypothetical protein